MMNNIYDWFMTNNRRDHLRALERVELGVNDTGMFSNISTVDAYYSFKYTDNIAKRIEKKEKAQVKAEINERLDKQKGSLNDRIQGFLQVAGVDKEVSTGYGKEREERPSRVVEVKSDKGQDEESKGDEAKADETKEENTEENGDGTNTKVKRAKSKKLNLKDLEYHDREEAKKAILNFEPLYLLRARKTNRVLGLPFRLTPANIFRPNISSVTTALLATTYAPDDITPSRINYSKLDASISHKLLDLAITVQNGDLLALAEKACGMYAQPLDVDLRTRYISFKEDMLRNPGKLR